MHDDHNETERNEMDNREYVREIDDITDEEFCRSLQWFFEGVPDENNG
jgi:hypothetical protein